MNDEMVVPEGLKEKAPYWSEVIENNDLYEIQNDEFTGPVGCMVNLDIGNWKYCVTAEVYGFDDLYRIECEDCSYFSRSIGTEDSPSEFEILLENFNNHLDRCDFYASQRK